MCQKKKIKKKLKTTFLSNEQNVLKIFKLFTLSSTPTYIISIYATYINVNKRCVFINDIPQCHSSTRASFNGGSAIIFSKYNGSYKNDEPKPGCVLVADWPKNYGSIYFGENNCLSDSNGFIINGQCCQNKDSLH
ncbi:unnamed protein product [Cunninghamella echinulata]